MNFLLNLKIQKIYVKISINCSSFTIYLTCIIKTSAVSKGERSMAILPMEQSNKKFLNNEINIIKCNYRIYEKRHFKKSMFVFVYFASNWFYFVSK